MKIAIIGGLGFIGTNLYFLLNKNYKITIFDNYKIKTNIKFLTTAKIIKGDIKNLNFLRKNLKNFDIVINLAAQTGVLESNNRPVESINDNIIGFYNILEISKINKIKTIINASTAGAIYGNTKKVCNERSPTYPISYYGLTKKFNEDQSLIYKNQKLKIINLRFSNVYGEFSIHKKSLIHNTIKNIINKKNTNINGDGTQIRDFIYVGDLVKIIKKSFKLKSGIYNVASGKSHSVNSFINILRNNEFEAKILYKKKKKGEVEVVKIDNKKIQKSLKIKTKFFLDFEKGVKKTFNWYKNYY
jgi:UDP-glucose 4-epimerase